MAIYVKKCAKYPYNIATIGHILYIRYTETQCVYIVTAVEKTMGVV